MRVEVPGKLHGGFSELLGFYLFESLLLPK